MTDHPPGNVEEPTSTPFAQALDYARPGAAGLSRLQRILGKVSLIVASLSLALSGSLTILLGAGAIITHQRIVAIPAQAATINGVYAAHAGRLARLQRMPASIPPWPPPGYVARLHSQEILFAADATMAAASLA